MESAMSMARRAPFAIYDSADRLTFGFLLCRMPRCFYGVLCLAVRR